MNARELIIHPSSTTEPDGSMSEFVRAIATITARLLVADPHSERIQSDDPRKERA